MAEPAPPAKEQLAGATTELATQEVVTKKEASAGATYARIFHYASRQDVLLNIIGAVAAVGSGTLLAVVNVVFGRLVDETTKFTDGQNEESFRSTISRYSLYFVYFGIGRFGCAYIYATCLTIASTRTANRIRQSYLKAILSQQIGFFDAEDPTSVSTQVTNSGNLIQTGTGEKLGVVVQSASALIASFVVAFTAQWKLTLITCGIIPALLVIVGTAAGLDAKYQTQILEIWNSADAFAEDAIASMRIVCAYSAAPKLLDRYAEYLERAYQIGKKKSPLYGVMFATEYFLIFACFALAFWRGVHMYDDGEVDGPGPVVTVIFSIVIAANSCTQLAPHIMTFVNAISGANTLFKIIDTKSQIDPFDQARLQPSELHGNIEFSNVRFAYPSRPGVEVLKDFSLKVPARKVTALVGASGSGKSTIVGLLERWYDPTSGTITLDGVNTKELNLRWLRTSFGLVRQEPVLFTGTIYENVCYGLVGTPRENSGEEEKRQLVERACRTANAHDFILELPGKYDAQCGERGSRLSGGQRQRIALAISIVSDPAILLLDEATSALDPHSEGAVQAALDKAAVNRTTIVIAHKLATIKDADNIVVMSKGQIVEQGTHESLLAMDGAYARLVSLQDLGENKSSEDESEAAESEKDTLATTTTMTPTETQLQYMQKQQRHDDYDLHKTIGTLSIAWKLLSGQKRLLYIYAVNIIACIASAATYPAQALLFTEEMEVFSARKANMVSRGSFFALMFLVVAIGNFIIFGILGHLSNTISQTITRVYKQEMFQSILAQDMRFFDRPENTVGALTSRLSTGPQSLNDLLGFNLGIILIAVFNLAASCALALAYGWKLSLVVIFAGLPPLVAAGWVRVRLEAKMNTKISKDYAHSAAFAGEAVSAIRTVAALTIEEAILKRYALQLSEVVEKIIRSTLHLMIYFALTQTIDFFFLALGFWYGCTLIVDGEYTIRQFYIIFLSVFFAGQAMAQLFTYTTSITKAAHAGNYIFWLRGIRPSADARPSQDDETGSEDDGKDPEKSSKSVDVAQVRFAYPLAPKTQVLRGIDIQAQPGQFIALVGASGCGKSTMIALLERFYDPIAGCIKFGGRDIRHLSPREYRRNIALVQQEPTLYMGSIRYNIGLGLEKGEEISDAALEHACREAHCWDFISSLPQGLETPCGSKGLSLSGGERQRINVARSLLRDPRILLLDEATSALDTESEKVVQQALTMAATDSKRITVAVAHRLSTIKGADAIHVFLAGKIVESGTHVDLLARGGLYAKMCQAQSLDRAV